MAQMEDKNFKNQVITTCSLSIIILIALILRLIHIKIPTGLWLDEIISEYTANLKFPNGIIICIAKDIHAPFYFFILHFWMQIFGNTDISLRACSVLFGILNIPAAYLVGKELDSKKTGLIAALFVGLNSFLIYYSQEVRFYSLATLLTTLSVFFSIKVFKKLNKKNLFFLVIINTFLIFTFTISIFLVMLEILVLGVYFYIKNKSVILKFILSQTLIPLLLFSIYIPILLRQIQNKSIQISFSADFNFSNLYLYLQNWFSPIINGLNYNFPNYFSFMRAQNLVFIVFTLIPVLLALIGLTRAFFTKNIVKILLITIFSFLIFELIILTFNNICILSRYTIIVLPTFLVIMAYGFASFKKKFLSLIIIISYISINISYIFLGHNSVFYIYRLSGLNIPATILKENFELSKNDIILITAGNVFFRKYFSSDYGNIIDYLAYDPPILNKTLSKELIKKNYVFFKPYLITKKPLPGSEEFFVNNIYNKLQHNRYFIILREVGVFDKNDTFLSKIANSNLYQKTKLNDLIQNKFLNDIESLSFKKYHLIYSDIVGNWLIIVYQNS